jgi:hypothetical protein
VRATLDTLGALLIALVAAVLAWRMGIGASSFRAANDQSTILAIPTWWVVAAMVPSFALLCAAGLYTAWQHWHGRTGEGDKPPARRKHERRQVIPSRSAPPESRSASRKRGAHQWQRGPSQAQLRPQRGSRSLVQRGSSSMSGAELGFLMFGAMLVLRVRVPIGIACY